MSTTLAAAARLPGPFWRVGLFDALREATPTKPYDAPGLARGPLEGHISKTVVFYLAHDRKSAFPPEIPD
jgi:hypothetical protein